jgi:6-phosphofructo-2-kinase/fructose-2,6-biphosphatase 4
MTRAFHFWSGEGRDSDTGGNLYENFAEATLGKGSVLPDSGVNFASDVQNMESEAAEEEAKDKVIKAELAQKALRRRLGSQDGTMSAPSGAALKNPAEDGLAELRDEDDAVKRSSQDMKRERSSESEREGSGSNRADHAVSQLKI